MSCDIIPAIPTMSYGEFSKSILDKAGARRVPIGFSFEITGSCNVRCVHCYMPDADRQNELSTDEIKRMLDEFAKAGVLWLLITGGEPLFRKDFEEIYLHAKKKGYIITIFSNGTLINERVADLFAEWPPFSIEITVHSMNPDTFDRIAGVRGSHDRCIKAIKLLSERDISLKLKSVAMRANKEDLEGVKRFAEEIGAGFRFDPGIQPTIDRRQDPLSLRLSPKEIIELDYQFGERMEAWRKLFDRYDGNLPEFPNQIYTCGAGINTFHVNAEGKLSACTMTQHASYDLKNGSFEEAWSDFLPTVLLRKPRTEYKCGSCVLAVLCGRCPGWAYLEEGDEEAGVDFLCTLGSLRKRAIEEYVAAE